MNELIAYNVYESEPTMRLVPASRNREWMDNTPQGFAKRCLPMLLSNQAGWHLLNSHAIRVTWNGGIDKSALHIEYDAQRGPGMAVSHFGSGVLTWNIPFLFRTSEDYNLLVRGPANYPKDGISPLEGLVETDWTRATFTMNWKCTRPGVPVVFAVGEPICLILPQKRYELESFVPTIRPIAEEPTMLQAYTTWSQERLAFNADLNIPGSEASQRLWQKDYFQGKGIAQHQTKLKLQEFTQEGETH